ncbi:hypothetical protein [Nocardia salmonicida]|uniref:hypothetical protein n=1 Tax=Nocardia salmonicida TaxID=53431 RepID=UPI0007A4904C|nr:hypothetical protein [Nocardia salmonicida]
MIDEQDDRTPVIRIELIGIDEDNANEAHYYRIDRTWSLEDAVDSFLDELSAAGSVTTYSDSGGEILVEAELADRSFPSMHFDRQLLYRLASTGMPLQIKTGPRTTA